MIRCITRCLALLVALCSCAFAVGPGDIGVIYLLSDTSSKDTAFHYAARRGIPNQHIVGVDLPADTASIRQDEFKPAFDRVAKTMPAAVQVYALTWTLPYRVECMSITSAFAFGYDQRYCAQGCRPTHKNPYFGSSAKRPFDEHRMRPTMLLSAGDVESTRALIDRGIAADFSLPVMANALLLSTTDTARNVRSARYRMVKNLFHRKLNVQVIKRDWVTGMNAVMFYFIGSKQVPQIASNQFLPGAVADHLTSAGGELDGSRQMSALEWLKAGATGSYGTVVEPCNFPDKFPNPAVVMAHYLNGDTLVEAYWKSVRMPGQGLFIGEPLARPFASN